MKAVAKIKWIELEDGVRVKLKVLTLPGNGKSRGIRIVGWKGMEENGKPLMYSRLEAKRVFKEYPAIAMFLHEAVEVDHYFEEV